MSAASRFPLLGEPLCIDLVNTVVRRRGEEADLLPDPAALDSWLAAQAGRVQWPGRATNADVAALRELRAALRVLLSPHQGTSARPSRDRAITAVNRALDADPGPRLTWSDGRIRLRPPSPGSRLARLLHTVASDAVSVLTGGADRIRQCAHPDCVLLFVADHPRRRWCTGTGCGNRARVARSHARGADRTAATTRAAGT